MKRGLLLTLTEPPPAMGWVADAAPGEGRHLATYELDAEAVLSSPEHLARFEGATPWTRRCPGKAVVFRRWACEQTQPGDADPHPMARALLLVASDTPLAELPWEGVRAPAFPGAALARVYRSHAA